MSKSVKIACDKVKNPCKICLGSVTEKTGLKCYGACQSWVHYECCNYTPGKIQDIRKGIIKVICPCPDCESQLPREYRIDKPQACANQQCPASMPPKCENRDCPVYDLEPSQGFQDSMNQMPSYQWPGLKCGTDCKKFPSPLQSPPPKSPPNEPRSRRPECKVHNPQSSIPTSRQVPQSLKQSYLSAGEHNTVHDFQRPNVGDTGSQMMPRMESLNSQRILSFSVIEQMAKTVEMLSKQLNELMYNMKDSMMRGQPQAYFPNMTAGPPSSQGIVAGQQYSRGKAQSCSHRRGPGGGLTCVQIGNKSNCPKPCHCPDNPRHNINIRP